MPPVSVFNVVNTLLFLVVIEVRKALDLKAVLRLSEGSTKGPLPLPRETWVELYRPAFPY